ncbi:D-alanyl-D-alanine carboxypeptidase family protein [Bacillus carboniphilus]|uniref:serine-type D-Ala-D-Ala carboxypeptidase n=1 Tax=Bacillus carboniphilus TaxID=86663 RepID=A0ABY9K1T1_9BACI|nr:D-alanyl-D-alanine carboxypeptidase family protein [Bacillus carboniphilus]WLR43805.1 D-alanyl-D-alanine carboxypeptidase family protein [Bacillus carboniphilus]
MKRIIVAIFAFMMIVAPCSTILANEEKSKSELAEKSKSAILIERDTGHILYQKNSEEPLPPASMTKIMTMLLIMEALEDGKLQLDEKVRASEYAASMGGSQIFLEAGEEMTVEELLKGIAIGSGNDASVAMAERLAGSEEEFVEQMNERANELGLTNTHFENPTGLPEKEHYSTAKDMAMLAKELLKYEDITKFTGKYEDYLREDTEKKFWLVNTNRLVKFYPGVDGIKTGYTSEAKYCLTATAKKGNMRVVAVVFGAPTPKERNAQVTKMLDYAFNQYETHPIFDRSEKVSEVNIAKGQEPKSTLVTSEPISILTKKGEGVYDIKQEVTFKEDVVAPVEKGDELGLLTLKKGEETMVESKLVAEEKNEIATWWTLFKRVMGNFTKSI